MTERLEAQQKSVVDSIASARNVTTVLLAAEGHTLASLCDDDGTVDLARSLRPPRTWLVSTTSGNGSS
jgi:hypothetical protein